MIENEIEQTTTAPCVIENSTALHLSKDEAHMGNTICVDIFIAEHCYVCEYAHEVAAFIGAKFPQVKLRMIDMADPQIDIPDSVFATPTYLLNGRLWSLGNPSNEEVMDKLSCMLAEM